MKAEIDPRKLIAAMTISVAILFFATYLVSIADGHNTLCNPFISGCSDITHAGFTSYEKYMLKAVLIPTATLMAVIFFFIQQLLVQISDYSKAVIKQGKAILFLASVGCIGLIIGTAVIDGQDTPMNVHLKAVAVFFVLMSVCQVWYTIIEYKYSAKLNKIPLILRRIAILITIAFSIWSVFMDQTTINHNIVEWWGVYALIFWFWTFSITKVK
ncbi:MULTISPECIES: hypothetical protein [Francisella]|uniref:CWH43-like N-terminal domain-containing protein n=1 Tax=Francisella opportunistica TaxID=2016517 RepID=A0A345JTG8_9GAMM|nr:MULTISPECIES: hypothetical protein [Francisella]APC92412.1 hypothetical protein BBG19_1688 [Francisella sp. MA067296]AXH30614.1 hypothetical protein CGC43_08550 [Francisella opportunistica]AXH32255.1 hypothetical protein CGC44_08525 [Francisella opportunistica]AXH33904.1 hypothetical protein CGC45_08585 [Francisella opportunistica]